MFLLFISYDYLYTAEIINNSNNELTIQIKESDSTQIFKLQPKESFELGMSRHNKNEILDSTINFKTYKKDSLILDCDKNRLEKLLKINQLDEGTYSYERN